LICREQAGCDNGSAATISMHASSPFPAKCRNMQIRAGCDKARAKAAKSTAFFSNTINFARGMNPIFQICDMLASGKFAAAGNLRMSWKIDAWGKGGQFARHGGRGLRRD
jgi:hypothetical protein